MSTTLENNKFKKETGVEYVKKLGDVNYESVSKYKICFDWIET